MDSKTHRESNTGLIILLGIITIIALVIAWSAFNRSGQDLGDTIEEETMEAAAEVEQEAEEFAAEAELALARAEARAELAALEARIAAGAAVEEVEADLAEIEADLDRAYANASAEARQEYREIEAEFSQAEAAVRDGAGDTAEFFAGLLLLLEDDVRVDSDTNGEIRGDVD